CSASFSNHLELIGENDVGAETRDLMINMEVLHQQSAPVNHSSFFDYEKYGARHPPLLERGLFLEKETTLFGGKRYSRIGLLVDHGELAFEIKAEAAGDVRRAFKKHLTVRA